MRSVSRSLKFRLRVDGRFGFVVLIVPLLVLAGIVMCRRSTESRGLVRLNYTGAGFTKPASAVLPKYRFSMGQRLFYRTDCWFPWNSGTEEQIRLRTVWVTDSNADGSWRIVLLVRSASTFLDSAGRESWRQTGSRLVYFDMTCDGRHETNPTVLGADPAMFFPQMPADSAEAVEGWQYGMEAGQDTIYCTLGGLKVSEPWLIALHVRQVAVQSAAVPARSTEVVLFDTGRGLLWRREGRYYRPGEWRGEGCAAGELQAVAVLPPEELAAFKRNADIYFKAWSDSRRLMGLTVKQPARVDSLGAVAESLLARARSQITDTLIRAVLDEDAAALREHVRHLGERDGD
jgi:hypothetical protein